MGVKMFKNLLFLSLLTVCSGLSAAQPLTFKNLSIGTNFESYKKLHEADVIKEIIDHSIHNAPKELQQNISQNPSLAHYRYWFAETAETRPDGHRVQCEDGTEYYLYKYNVAQHVSQKIIINPKPIIYEATYNYFTNDFNLFKTNARNPEQSFFPGLFSIAPKSTQFLSSAFYAHKMLAFFIRSLPTNLNGVTLLPEACASEIKDIIESPESHQSVKKKILLRRLTDDFINDSRAANTSHAAFSTLVATCIHSIIYKTTSKESAFQTACELLTEEQYLFLRQKKSSHQPYKYDSLRGLLQETPSWNRYDVFQAIGCSVAAGAIIFGISTFFDRRVEKSLKEKSLNHDLSIIKSHEDKIADLSTRRKSHEDNIPID